MQLEKVFVMKSERTSPAGLWTFWRRTDQTWYNTKTYSEDSKNSGYSDDQIGIIQHVLQKTYLQKGIEENGTYTFRLTKLLKFDEKRLVRCSKCSKFSVFSMESLCSLRR